MFFPPSHPTMPGSLQPAPGPTGTHETALAWGWPLAFSPPSHQAVCRNPRPAPGLTGTQLTFPFFCSFLQTHPVNALCMPAEGSPSPWLATFPAASPLTFWRSRQRRFQDDDYMIARCFAIITQCKWVVIIWGWSRSSGMFYKGQECFNGHKAPLPKPS